jgi:hypothetical protein
LELSVAVEGNSAHNVGERERGRGGNPTGQGPESRADVEESPSRGPEWSFSSCLQCVRSGVVILKNHSMSSTRAILLDCFHHTAKLLAIAFRSDGQVPLKQFIMDNRLHIPQAAQHGRPERGVSLMSKLHCLKHAKHFWTVLSAIELLHRRHKCFGWPLQLWSLD